MRQQVLRFLRVEERPAVPPDAGPTLVTFRASRRFLTLSVIEWLPKQLGGLVGLVVSLAALGVLDLSFPSFLQFGRVEDWLDGIDIQTLSFTLTGPTILLILESFAVGGYVIQLVVTGLLLKPGWEMRWYMVSDECLRIREGLFRVREQTMTVVNIQNMNIRQGPLQRLLGLAELEVHTAGGGVKGDEKQQTADLHVGHFRGLEDAWALRDRLRLALARCRDAGLGDPDDASGVMGGGGGPDERSLADTAHALRDEARRLRAVLEEQGRGHGA